MDHIVGTLEAALEPPQDRRRVRVPEVGHHHPDGRAEPPPQPPGHHVVPVAELLGHPLDPRPRLRRHRVRRLRVERPRRRGHMHARRRGDVPQRHRPPNGLPARHTPHLPPAAANPTSAWGDTVSAGRHPEGGRGSDMRYRTTILQSGKTATGIEVPDEVMEALGSGKRPAVTVTVNGYSYRSTVATVAGRSMVGVSA